MEWHIGDQYSKQEVRKIKRALVKYGKKGMAILVNLNNDFLEEEDLDLNKKIFKENRLTEEDVLEVLEEAVMELKSGGFKPDYDDFNIELGEISEVGEIVSVQVPWRHTKEDLYFIQLINISFDDEIVGIFMQRQED